MTNLEVEKQPLNGGAKREHVHTEKTTCSSEGSIVFVLGLVCGTFSAVCGKMAYDCSSEGLNGEMKLFAKPIMMLLLMFTGMVPAIFFWKIQQHFTAPAQRDVVPTKTLMVLIVPCVCDLLCTLLLLIAQLYITASMWQMMRGTVIIVTALLKNVVLKHKLRKHMWFGVFIITFAMMLVASTSFFGNTDEGAKKAGRDPRVGILLVVFGCVAQGVQYVFEEKVMSVDNAPPLVVIGAEGLWGTFLSLVLVYPIAYLMPGADNGSYEDPFDAIAMIQNSKALQWITLSFVLTVTGYNCMAVYVTKYLSAIWHAILDNFRPVTIWALGLSIYYVIAPGSGFGEMWTPASYLQLGGLLVLFFGTAVYNGSVAVCDDEYMALEMEDEGLAGKDDMIKTTLAMASPTLTRSPLVYLAEKRREAEAANELPRNTGRSYYNDA